MKGRYIPNADDVDQFGFEWTPGAFGLSEPGPHYARLIVQRSAIVGGKEPRTRHLTVYTPRDTVEIVVSPTGRVRAFRGAAELKERT